MGLDNAGRNTDGMALVHLVVECLKGQLLGLAVSVCDGAFSSRLTNKYRLWSIYTDK